MYERDQGCQHDRNKQELMHDALTFGVIVDVLADSQRIGRVFRHPGHVAVESSRNSVPLTARPENSF